MVEAATGGRRRGVLQLDGVERRARVQMHVVGHEVHGELDQLFVERAQAVRQRYLRRRRCCRSIRWPTTARLAVL